MRQYWEYKVLTEESNYDCELDMSDEEMAVLSPPQLLEAGLNALGKEGWEMVTMITEPPVSVILKRIRYK